MFPLQMIVSPNSSYPTVPCKGGEIVISRSLTKNYPLLECVLWAQFLYVLIKKPELETSCWSLIWHIWMYISSAKKEKRGIIELKH